MLQSKNDVAYLLELASARINVLVIRFIRLQYYLVEWWNNCLRETAFRTPPNENGIDFDSLYDELSHRTCLSTKTIPIPMTKCLHFISMEVKNG